jgi:putative addiction module component (TIGR02574 family)
VVVTKKAQALLEQALKLSRREKLALARRIVESVDESDDDELSPGWREEIGRRVARVVSGKAKGYSAEETMAYVRQKLADNRAARGKKTQG